MTIVTGHTNEDIMMEQVNTEHIRMNSKNVNYHHDHIPDKLYISIISALQFTCRSYIYHVYNS